MPASLVLLLSFEDDPTSPLKIRPPTAIHHAFGFFSLINVMVRFPLRMPPTRFHILLHLFSPQYHLTFYT